MNVYAFPRPLPNVKLPPDQALESIKDHAGMMLKDYFAGSAMQAILSNQSLVNFLGTAIVKKGTLAGTERYNEMLAEEIAALSYLTAKAMMRERINHVEV